jgi:hypothetical protein
LLRCDKSTIKWTFPQIFNGIRHYLPTNEGNTQSNNLNITTAAMGPSQRGARQSKGGHQQQDQSETV